VVVVIVSIVDDVTRAKVNTENIAVVTVSRVGMPEKIGRTAVPIRASTSGLIFRAVRTARSRHTA